MRIDEIVDPSISQLVWLKFNLPDYDVEKSAIENLSISFGNKSISKKNALFLLEYLWQNDLIKYSTYVANRTYFEK